MHSSTLSERGQATIPAAVRAALSLHKGDKIIYEPLDDDRWVLRKMPSADKEWAAVLAASLHEELSSEADDAFFAYLTEA